MPMKMKLCAVVAVVALAACSPAANKHQGQEDHAGHGAAMEEAKPKSDLPGLALTAAQAAAPQTALINQTVTVSLPVKLADMQVWVSGSKMADLGPFMFHGLEEQPGAGPNGGDLVVFTYMAHEAGDGVLKFARVPAGANVIGPGAKPEAALETVEFKMTAK
jgi:hypothetical protein